MKIKVTYIPSTYKLTDWILWPELYFDGRQYGKSYQFIGFKWKKIS